MTNRSILAATQLMLEALPSISFAFPIFFPLFIFKFILLTLKYGNCPESGLAYVSYAIVISRLGQLKLAKEFLRIGTEVQDKWGTPNQKPVVTMAGVGFIVWQWQKFKDVQERIERGYRAAYQVGNLENMAYAVYATVIFDYLAGDKLSGLYERSQTAQKTLKNLNQRQYIELAAPGFQLISSLFQGVPAGEALPQQLNGEYYDENHVLDAIKSSRNNLALFDAQTLSSYFNVLCGFHEQALPKLREIQSLLQDLPISYCGPLYFYTYSIALIRSYREKKDHSILRKVKKNQKALKIWADSAPMNFCHLYLLVEAEQLTVQEKSSDQEKTIEQFYEQAFETAVKNQMPGDAGFSAECFANYYFRKNNEELGKKWILRAYHHYEKWEANLKLRDLEQKF